MKISSYFIKKWIAYILCGALPIMFFIMSILISGDLIIAYIMGIMGIIICAVMSNKLLHHPFSALVEGSGIVTLDVNSTGIIGCFISQMSNPPKIIGIMNRLKHVTDVYERDLVHTLFVPYKGVLVDAVEVDVDSGEHIGKCQVLKMPEKNDYNKLFSFEGKPTFIYNRNLDMYVGKDYLSRMETESTLQHSINHLLNLGKHLSENVDPFARYVVEMTRPKKSWLSGKMKWILIAIIVIMIVVLLAMFAPSFIGGIQSGMQGLVPAGSGGHIP